MLDSKTMAKAHLYVAVERILTWKLQGYYLGNIFPKSTEIEVYYPWKMTEN
jgi:hypothetical protein